MKAAAESDMVVCIGPEFWEITDVTQEYPYTNFIWFCASIENPEDYPNLHSVVFAGNEGSYLVGYVAAAMSQTGVIGAVLGDEDSYYNGVIAGFTQGARQANDTVEVVTNHAEGNYNDFQLGRDLAKELLDQEGVVDAICACETDEDFRKLLYGEEKKESEYKESCDALVDSLKLRHRPIGVKIYHNGETVPDKYWRPYRDAHENYAMCQIVSKVKNEGMVIALTKEDHWCWKPLIGLGLVDVEKGSEAYDIFLRNNGCMDMEQSAANMEHFPRLERNDTNAILIGPLEKLDVTPDVVLVYTNTNQQARWMIGRSRFPVHQSSYSRRIHAILSFGYSSRTSIPPFR